MILSFERVRDHLADAVRSIRPYHVALALLAPMILLAAYAPGDVFFAVAVLGVATALLLLWVREFVLLMRCGDDDLPGRFDKAIWAAVLLLVPPLGAVAFWAFRRAHWADAKPSPRVGPHDLF